MKKPFVKTKPLLLLVCCVLLLPGCAGMFPGGPSVLKTTNGKAYTTRNLRDDLNTAVQRIKSDFQRTIKKVSNRTNTPDHRRYLVLWKLESFPLLDEILRRPDERNALVSLTFFLGMLNQYVEKGKGRTIFGPHQSTVRDIIWNAMKRSRTLLQKASGEQERKRIRSAIQTFVKNRSLGKTPFSFAPIKKEILQVSYNKLLSETNSE